MKVLVVDRESFLAELVKLALEADGHECVTATNVEEASEFLRSVRFDLLALDLDEGYLNSFPWLEATILGHPELQGRTFVLASRPLEAAEATRVRACGAQVIRKPFTLHELRDTVRIMTPAGEKRASARPRDPMLEP
jgi:DNA-binding response OmpR family regulator